MTTFLLLLVVLSTPAQQDPSDTLQVRPADLLEELAYPDRWRWVPNDRLPKGGLVNRLLVTSFVSPIFFFEGDVGAGGGVGVTDIDFLGKRRSQFANTWITYTSEGQQRFSFSWRKWLAHIDDPGRGILQGDRDHVGISLESSRTLTSRFFGLGASTTLDDESSFTRATDSLGFNLQKSLPQIGGPWIYSLGVTLQTDDISSGQVSEALNTVDEYPILTSEGDDFGAVWVQGSLRHDTRDAQHLPYEGHTIGISLLGCPIVSQETNTDSLEGGLITTLHGSWVRPVAPLFHSGGDQNREHPPIDSIAGYLKLSMSSGELPFWSLPSLGGSNSLRGSISGRWRGQHAWSAGAEWRPWVIPEGFAIYEDIRLERGGFALFLDLGSVSESLDQLIEEPVHYSYGIGLRFTFERQALFRADLGRSDDGEMNMSIRYGLPF
ncbi:MAG: BamA/TamA family outer membrane protein [Planctomycetia bacterium]|nr:BamA/TamA family outer membrane protein [Planctomycetia bacterium]